MKKRIDIRTQSLLGKLKRRGIALNSLRYFTFIFVVLFSAHHAGAQNFSGLKDKTLKKVEDISTIIGGLLTKPEGEISNVTVKYDSENKLKLSIEYSGLEEASLSIKTLNGQKKAQYGIRHIELSLDGKSSPVEIEMLLDETLPEGTNIKSPYLEIKAFEDRNELVKKRFLFELNKKWQTKVKPENLVIPVILEPIASAANLKESEEVIIMPKIKPQLTNIKFDHLSLYEPDIMSTSATVLDTRVKDIDGTWVNTDKNTRGITTIVISNGGQNIRVYGKCHPKDCDWGIKKLIKTRGQNTYSATFESNHATSYFSLDFGTKLSVEQNRVYSGTGRAPLRSSALFEKVKLLYFPATIVSPSSSTDTETTESAPTNNTEAQGPDNKPISLWEDLVADINFEFPHEITNIRMDIYPDKNPGSGVFYYLPTAYHLRWNSDEGYRFKMLYGTAATPASLGNVRMTGTITPGISTKEIALMKSLLKSYVESNSNYDFTELKVIPVKTNPKISFSSGLGGQYDIPSEKVDIAISSSITAPIEVSWITDNRTKEEMQVALMEGAGIQGLMTLEPDSESVPTQLIPVRITLADNRTLGRFSMQSNTWRNENWVNNTPYPLKLKYMHALIIEKQDDKLIPLIYSWSLGNTEIPPSAKAAFNADKMPEWLEKKGKAERIWLDYSIVDCDACLNKVVNDLTGGTYRDKVKNITFETFQVMETTGAAFLKIRVRSTQGGLKGNNMVELPSVRVTKDMAIFSTGLIYIPEGAEPAFEYFFTLVMPDGTAHKSDKWISSNEVEQFIGMRNIKEAISSYPQ